ncbi:MAG TPA: hypothetical protein VGK74_10630 [Symbiobacteriaceae bacterium]|jgi:NAD-dependent SIR2 family protein deacetylase
MDVYIFGAGASAAEGAPAVKDFLARGWELLAPDFDDRIRAVWRFLETIFRTPVTGPEAFAFMPAVDELISLVDWSLHVNQGLGFQYDPPRLYQVRRDLEHLLSATLDAALQNRFRESSGPHARFVRALLDAARPGEFALLSLNYDTLLDDALLGQGAVPNYGLDPGRQGPFLGKLHGSLNWALCPACSHITVADEKVAHLLPYVEGLSCRRCGNERLNGLIVSPTWLKNYEGFRLQHIWDQALEWLQRADRIVFVGYSVPPADVAIYQLIRRALLAGRHRGWTHVDVINHRPEGDPVAAHLHEQAVVERFTHLFGRAVKFDFSGFHGQI